MSEGTKTSRLDLCSFPKGLTNLDCFLAKVIRSFAKDRSRFHPKVAGNTIHYHFLSWCRGSYPLRWQLPGRLSSAPYTLLTIWSISSREHWVRIVSHVSTTSFQVFFVIILAHFGSWVVKARHTWELCLQHPQSWVMRQLLNWLMSCRVGTTHSRLSGTHCELDLARFRLFNNF